MPTTGLKTWEAQAADAPGWRVERPEAKQNMSFFPDQNGGVYEKLLSNLPVMLQCMDGSGRMISANAAWCETLGYVAQDIIGRSFSEFLPMESRSRLVTDIYPRFLTSSSIRNAEILIHRKDGSLATVLLSMTAYRGDKGRLERSVCMLEDITDKKLTQIATGSRSDQRFRAAFAAAAHGMAVVSTSGHIEVANPSLATLLKRNDLESAHLSFDELLHKDDRKTFLVGMEQLLSGETAVLQQELRFMSGEGRIVRGATSIAQVKNDKGETEQLIVQITDSSERRQVNERLQKAQKMEAIGQLTGGLAHDFNNLLTVIIGNLQLLDGKFGPDDKSSKRVAEAIDAAQKGSDLTRQLLAIARKQELAPKDVDLNGLVTSMAPLVARSIGENFDLHVETMKGAPLSVIDASQLESAILNLAINARDAMNAKGGGGRITIETQPAFLDHFYAEKHADVTPGHYVLVAVSDTGAGMTPDVLEKVFQPFFTTKPLGQGNGLGLSMVYGFIKQSGGHISIYSEVGHGTSVKMYLPRKMDAGAVVDGKAESASAETPMAVPRGKKKILVVEDQEAVRAVACGFLEDFGYEVIEAGDGFQALSVLQEVPDIDLMFSDVVMPGGMNGFDLAQAAQSLKPDLKIVHTSGYPKGAMVHQDEPRFKNGFIIMKPYRRDDLEKIIKDALEVQ
jgi:PAS domain S-box-containing protein